MAPLAKLTWRTVEGVQARGSRSVEPTSTGSRVTLELTVEPTGVNRLLAPVLRRLLQRNMHADLQRLRELVEARSQWASAERAMHPSSGRATPPVVTSLVTSPPT